MNGAERRPALDAEAFRGVAIGRDYYEVLGLTREASAAEVKRAFRQRAHRFHPDKNPKDTASALRFSEVEEAYRVLSDPAQRQRYDADRPLELEVEAPAPAGERLGDLFSDLLGFTPSRQPERGPDLRYTLDLSFREAALGCERQITIQRTEPCPECDGSGARSGTQGTLCQPCQGQGTLRSRQVWLSLPRTCPACNGRGIEITDPCPRCAGTGVVRLNRPLWLRVPPATASGQRLRLRGEGGLGRNGGAPGDLFVVLQIDAHPLFTREGHDVHSQATLPMTLAALGGSFTIVTLHGPSTIAVPPGTQHGAVLRLAGLGLPGTAGDTRGDHVLHLAIEVPVDLDSQQRQQLEVFAQLGGAAPERHPQHRTFLERQLEVLREDDE